MAESRKPWEHAKRGGSEADAFAQAFVSSLDDDWRLYRHDIAGSLAHARMLAHVGLISGDDLAAIEKGLRQIELEIDEQGEAWAGWKIELEDVHMCLEAALIEKVGEAGKKLHTGRSRNDQVALDLRLWIDEACNEIQIALIDLQGAFVEIAERDGDIVVPSYTHLQRAQPITVGGEMMAWLSSLGACEDRLETMIEWSNQDNPLGSGAIAGSSLPLDREFSTAQLNSRNMAGPSQSSIYATASRDVAVDFVYALSMTAMWLSRWAEQWIIYMSGEFGFLKIGDAYTTGSSMMPQKRNPDMLELVRGRCGGVYGHLMALLTICKGQPIGYNRDMQEDKQHVFAAYDTVRDCLEMATRIVNSAAFDEARIKATLDEGFLDATSLAEYLVTKGVAFRTAHQHVGTLVRLCEEKGVRGLGDLALADLREVCEVIGADVGEWLGAENVVARYQTYGNAGVSGYREQLAAWKARLGGEDAPESGDGEPGLFGDVMGAGDEADALIAAYRAQGRTLDDLPYTDEFEAIVAAVGVEDRGAVFHRLQGIRKAGLLPKLGRAKGKTPVVTGEQEQLLVELVMEVFGGLTLRDQLPYTSLFDGIVDGFNARAGLNFSPHQVWRVIAKLAK